MSNHYEHSLHTRVDIIYAYVWNLCGYNLCIYMNLYNRTRLLYYLYKENTLIIQRGVQDYHLLRIFVLFENILIIQIKFYALFIWLFLKNNLKYRAK